MPASTTLPVMAGLSILGAALGVNLGRSAISEINPSYYSEPETRFHGDLSANQSPDWAQGQAQYVSGSRPVLVGDLGSGCIGCRDYPVEYVPVHDPAVDGYQDGYAASAPAPAPAQIVIVETPAPDPARERLQRYASFPVSAEGEPPANPGSELALSQDLASH